MLTTDLVNKAIALAQAISDEHLRVTVSEVDEATGVVLDGWYGLINGKTRVGAATLREGRIPLEKFLGREMLHSLAQHEETLDETGRVLHGSLVGKLNPSLYVLPSLSQPVIIPEIQVDHTTLRLKRYYRHGKGPLFREVTWAAYHPESERLFMTAWEEEQPWGFANFVYELSDMELVVLQKQAREVEDKESLNLILNELGRRERNRASFFKPAAAKEGK